MQVPGQDRAPGSQDRKFWIEILDQHTAVIDGFALDVEHLFIAGIISRQSAGFGDHF